jgi:hypothetical protein
MNNAAAAAAAAAALNPYAAGLQAAPTMGLAPHLQQASVLGAYPLQQFQVQQQFQVLPPLNFSCLIIHLTFKKKTLYYRKSP